MEQDPYRPSTPTNMTPLPLPGEPRSPNTYGAAPVFYCIGCNHALTDATLGGQCPNCGTPTDQSLQHSTPSGTPGSAVAALVLGIAAIVSCVFYGLPGIVCGILAVVFAARADRMMNSGQYSTQGQGMVTAGRICGWIGLGLGLVYLVLTVIYIVFMVSMFQNMPHSNPNWSTPPTQQQPWNPPSHTPHQPPGTQPGGAAVEGDAIDNTNDDPSDDEQRDIPDQP